MQNISDEISHVKKLPHITTINFWLFFLNLLLMTSVSSAIHVIEIVANIMPRQHNYDMIT
jgi:SNF family Na+-dependent transporter